MGTMALQAKNIYMSTTHKKNKVMEHSWRGFLSSYLISAPGKLMLEAYSNKDKRDVLEDLRLIWKEEKRVNRFISGVFSYAM